jgi:hypothetical protein
VAPGYAAGLYQINAQIPSGVANGADFIDILTPDAEAEQVTLNIAGSSAAATAGALGTGMLKPSGRGRRAYSGRSSRVPTLSR